MDLQLMVVAGPDEGQTFPLQVGQPFSIGRGVDTQTRLRDPRVSRHHCEIQVLEDQVTLIDAGSTGGTFVNGQRISERQLQPGDIIRVGGTQMEFVSNKGDSTANWSGVTHGTKPATDLMETREMRRITTADTPQRSESLPTCEEDDETIRGEPPE